MPTCQECKTVVGVQDIKNGVCRTCLGEEAFSATESTQSIESGEETQKKDKSNDTWGIISFVLGVVGLFTLPILFGPIGLISGIVSKKSAFGIIGIILSTIQILVVILAIFGMALAFSN